MARDQRRLAAIVSADVAGYSRLMGQDDSDTLARLKAHRRELIDPKIAEYGGRIVKTTGDGLLLEFPSVVDAVRCAVDVQRGMAERNADVPADQRIDFRIGINLGDIIIDSDDIYGDGVNVAARLQTLAEPGGICVSRVVRDQVLDKLSFAFEDLGAQQVKNIARPVEVYRVDLGSEALRTPSSGRRSWQRLSRGLGWRWLAAGVVAIGIAGIAVWAVPHLWKIAPAASAPALSVAIFPLTAAGGSPADVQFADLVTRELTLGLGRTRTVHIAAPSSAKSGADGPIDARSVGRELNVRYLATGQLQHAGGKTRVTVQLIDAEKGIQTAVIRQELDDAQMGQDQGVLISRLTRRLHEAIIAADTARADKVPGEGASATELALHGANVAKRDPNSLSGLREAGKFFDSALRVDPRLVPALVYKAAVIQFELYLDPRVDHEALVREHDELSLRAVNADSADPRAWGQRTISMKMEWRWDAALEASNQELELDPIRIQGISNRADLMLLIGRPAEALVLVDQALALQPQDTINKGWPFDTACRAYVALGRYDAATASCEKAASFDDSWLPHLYLVAVYTHQGETAKAAAERTIVLSKRPTVSIEEIKALRESDNPAFLEQMETYVYSNLRKAGIPQK